MKTALSIIAATLLAMAATATVAQPFQLSGKWYAAKWTPGTWDGQHRLPNVYCLKFPEPQTAVEMGYGFYNKGSIFLTQVLYPEKVGAFIVASTRPVDRTVDDEITRLMAIERNAESAYATTYNIAQGRSEFGPTIQLKIRNVAPEGRGGPFPLVRAMLGPVGGPVRSMSVHRLFVHGTDRFEVATFQLAATALDEVTDAEMSGRLAVLADGLVQAIHDCTSGGGARTQQ